MASTRFPSSEMQFSPVYVPSTSVEAPSRSIPFQTGYVHPPPPRSPITSPLRRPNDRMGIAQSSTRPLVCKPPSSQPQADYSAFSGSHALYHIVPFCRDWPPDAFLSISHSAWQTYISAHYPIPPPLTTDDLELAAQIVHETAWYTSQIIRNLDLDRRICACTFADYQPLLPFMLRCGARIWRTKMIRHRLFASPLALESMPVMVKAMRESARVLEEMNGRWQKAGLQRAEEAVGLLERLLWLADAVEREHDGYVTFGKWITPQQAGYVREVVWGRYSTFNRLCRGSSDGDTEYVAQGNGDGATEATEPTETSISSTAATALSSIMRPKRYSSPIWQDSDSSATTLVPGSDDSRSTLNSNSMRHRSEELNVSQEVEDEDYDIESDWEARVAAWIANCEIGNDANIPPAKEAVAESEEFEDGWDADDEGPDFGMSRLTVTEPLSDDDFFDARSRQRSETDTDRWESVYSQ